MTASNRLCALRRTWHATRSRSALARNHPGEALTMTEHRLAARHFAWLAIILTGALLQACGPNDKGAAGPRQRLFAADLTGGAKVCDVPKITPTKDQSTDVA